VSPVTDLTLSSPSIDSPAGEDMLARPVLEHITAQYFDGAAPDRAPQSPLHGDLADLPPLLIVAGGDEALLDEDAELVAFWIGEDIPVDLLIAGADYRRSQAEQLRLIAEDIQVHPVLHRLRLRNGVDPDQRPLARGIFDRDRPVERAGASPACRT
jgi:acetyl esterase/lipase